MENFMWECEEFECEKTGIQLKIYSMRTSQDRITYMLVDKEKELVILKEVFDIIKKMLV